MEQRDDGAAPVAKKEYVRPKIVDLGTVVDKTLGSPEGFWFECYGLIEWWDVGRPGCDPG